MKKLFLITACIVISLSLFSQSLIRPDDPRIRYTGRVDFSDPLNPRFSYSGVTIAAEFTGTSITAGINASGERNYYYVIIDNGNPVKIHPVPSRSVYPLASSLKNTLHTIKIVKITEASMGTDQFTGFALDDGESLVSLPEGNGRVIEFIGNSITCGYGDETDRSEDHFRPDQENFYETYAAVTARAFMADAVAVCKSGIGMYRNYGGPVTGTQNTMPVMYDRTLFNTAEPVWDSTAIVPDVVCINLGTNDTSLGIFDVNLFSEACRKFLLRIRSNYPNALIVYLIGPMMGEHDASMVRQAVEQAFSVIKDPRMKIFALSTQTGEFGIGGDYHPTVAQHRHNAYELIEYLEKETGWKAVW
jgi:lysophospholipase L1-like esterase